MQSIQQQIESLQSQLQQLRREMAARDAQVKAAQAEAAAARSQVPQVQTPAQRPPERPAPPAVAAAALPPGTTIVTSPGKGKVTIGGVTVSLGGFLEAAGIVRTSSESADIASSWSGIPLANTPQNHFSEFRETARQSRVSLLVGGNVDPTLQLAAYGEVDFLGAAPTANSNESNSYNPRLRVAYATVDKTDWGVHALAGQSWSLLTLNRAGIAPRTEVLPLTIDAQYVPGFTWTRQPQARVVGDFLDHRLWLGASLESPQATFSVGPNGTGALGTATFNLPGGSGYASTNTYSTDVAPDLIVKAAADPGWGHYEVYGLGRLIRDRQSFVGSGSNHTIAAGGGGAAVLLPLVPKLLDFQGSFLAGAGIGRYGSAQLPDATIGANGEPVPIPEIEALVGLVGHPLPQIDLYGYVGLEEESKRAFSAAGKGYGYGSPLYTNSGCSQELSPSTCTANTAGVAQGTLGAWWRFLQGDFGTMQAGLQYAYTRRSIFEGVGGAPKAADNEVLVSFRYYPFQ